MTTQARELAKLVTNAGDLNLVDDISLASDGAILNFGADSDVNLTHVADTGLLLNSSRQLQFGDSGTHIRQSADGVLQLTSDTEVEINATTVDINANVDVSGNIVLGGTITVGDADDDNMVINANVNSHIIPNTDDTFDLGSASQQWRNVYVDGTLEADAITVADTALAEYISDTVGAMVSSNTESGIAVAYQDGDNTLDFTVATLNQDTTGTADNITATANNSTDETVYPTFVDGATGSQGIETDTGLTYNPSSGILTATQFTGAVTGNVTGNASGTAATVTTAAQPAITSLGTLTSLTVNNTTAAATVATFKGNYNSSGDVKLASFERSGSAVAAAVTYADATTDMEFGTTTSHGLSLTTADTRRLTIASGGAVTIPGTLGVTGALTGTSATFTPSSGENFVITRDSGGLYFGSSSNHNLRIITNNGERLRIHTGGGLTIQDTTSAGPHGTGQPDLTIGGNNAGSNSTELQVYRSAATGGYIGIDAFRSGVSGTDLILNAANGGKVGIGTTGPDTKLEIEGASANNYVTITNSTASDSDGNRYSKLFFRGVQSGGERSNLASVNAYHDGSADDQKGRLTFHTNDGDDGDVPGTKMTILSDGKVGIGNTSPSAILDVAGIGWINPADGTHSGWNFRQGDTFKGWVGYNDSTDVVNLSMDGSIVGGINVNASGNVGIGSSTIAMGGKLNVGERSGGTADMNIGVDANNRSIHTYNGGTFSIGTRVSSTNYFDTLVIKNGNVGVSADSPYAGTNVTSMTVNATSYPTMAMQVGGTNSYTLMGVGSSGMNIDSLGNKFLKLRTNDVDRLHITGGGFIGMGGATGAWIDSNDKLGLKGRMYIQGFGHTSASFGRYNSAGNAGEDGNIIDFLHGGSGKGTIGINATNIFKVTSTNSSGQLQLATHDANESIELNASGTITVEAAGVLISTYKTEGLNMADGKTISSDYDNGTIQHTHLSTYSGYSSTGAVVLTTNIPSHNVSGSTMFSIRLEGFSYDNEHGGAIDCVIGSYSGESAFHNVTYTAQNIPSTWIGKIRMGRNSSNKVVIILGDTGTVHNYELAVTNFVQGYSGTDRSYANNWSFTSTTSLSAYSDIVTIQPKETQQIGFEVQKVGYSYTSNSWEEQTWDSEVYDYGGYYNTSNGRFTPQVRGMYQFNMGGWMSFSESGPEQSRYAIAIAKNGSLTRIFGGNFSYGDTPVSGGSVFHYLNGSSDYVSIYMFSAEDCTFGHSSHPMWFQGIKINDARSNSNLTI